MPDLAMAGAEATLSAALRHAAVALRAQGVDEPAADARRLAAAVLGLIERPCDALEMTRAARRDVSQFTWGAVRSRWLDVYAGAEVSACQ